MHIRLVTSVFKTETVQKVYTQSQNRTLVETPTKTKTKQQLITTAFKCANTHLCIRILYTHTQKRTHVPPYAQTDTRADTHTKTQLRTYTQVENKRERQSDPELSTENAYSFGFDTSLIGLHQTSKLNRYC